MIRPKMDTRTGFFSRLLAGTVIAGGMLTCPVWAQFDNTNVLVEKAVNDIYQKRYKQAHQILREAYEQSPRHPGVHFNLARLFELTGNYSEALKEYQMAAVLDPSMVAARRGIARCGVEMKRQKGSVYQNSTQAMVPAPEKMPVPVSPQPRLPERAPVVTQTIPQPEPAPVFALPLPADDGSVKTPVTRPSGYAARPVLPIEGIDPSAPTAPAIELPAMPSSVQLPSTESLRVPPLPVEVSQKERERPKTSTQMRAESLIARGDAGQAIEVLQSGEPDSDNPNVHFLLGKSFSMKGDLFSAIKHLEETIRVDEHFHEAYYLLAQNYAKVNLLDDAMKNYLSYFAVKPQAGVAVEIARTYERMGKMDQAKEYYAKANAMNPGNPNLQNKLGQAENKLADDMYLRGNHALTMGDFEGAQSLFSQALSLNTLDSTYRRDAQRKIEVAKLRLNEAKKLSKPVQDGFNTTRRIYGTTNLKFTQLASIDFQTRFTQPVTVEWRGYVARSFRRYGRDFLLMIKELSRDELDEMGRDRNDYRLNPNFNNQPLFLLTAKQGQLPAFVKEGAFITLTGQTDWKRYDVINELGQTVKLPALEYVAAHP